MRIYSAIAALLVLTACSEKEEAAVTETAASEATAEPAQQAKKDVAIACAVGGAQNYERVCSVEQAPQDGKLFLVVHHPDGAFRRFEVLTDGRGLAAADGADRAKVRMSENLLEVTVDQDRYLFPSSQKKAAGEVVKP